MSEPKGEDARDPLAENKDTPKKDASIEAPQTPGHPMPPEQIERARRQTYWQKLRKRIAELRDPVGTPMDKKIIDIVTTLNCLKFTTTGSCEGELDHGQRRPWVHFQALNRPVEQVQGENAMLHTIAEEFGVSDEEVRRAIHEEAFNKFFTLKRKKERAGEETPEFKQWREENQKNKERLQKFLDEFYSDRSPDPDTRLHINTSLESSFLLVFLEEGEQINLKPFNELTPEGKIERKAYGLWQEEMEKHKKPFADLTQAEKTQRELLLLRRQEEILQFERFLRDKFLEGESIT